MTARARSVPLPSVHAGRAFAVVMVLGFHICSVGGTDGVLGQAFGSGGHGVDHFFVISGFVMVYAHQYERGLRASARFLRKRLCRIYPPYWIAMGSIWALGLGHITTHPLKAFLLIDQGGPAILQQAWSLTMEMAFYLLFLTFFLSRWFFAALAVAWCGLVLYNWLGVHWYAGLLLCTRVIEFFLGTATAWLVAQLHGWRIRGVWPLGAAVLLLAIFYADSRGWMPRYWDVLNYGPASALLIGTAALWDLWRHPVYPRWIIEIGNASYATYLIHYAQKDVVAAGMALTRSGAAQDAILMLGMLTILGTGTLFHWWLERPAVRWAQVALGDGGRR